MAAVVNLRLLPVKLFYVCYYGGVSCIVPYLAHYLQQHKQFSPVDVTTILAASRFLAVLTKPTVAHIADRTQNFRAVVLLTLTIGCVFTCCLALVPPVDSPSSQRAFQLALPANHSANDTEPQSATHFGAPEFWLLALCLLTSYSCGLSTSYTLVDAWTLRLIAGTTLSYGRQRMWMAVGVAGALLAVSLLVDAATPAGARTAYAPAFVGFVVCIALSAACVCFIPSAAPPACDAPPTDGQRRSGGARALLPLLLHRRVAAFLLMALVCGVNFGMSTWLPPFYLKVNLFASQTAVGASIVVVCLSSMAGFYAAAAVVAKVGHELSLAISILLYGIRALIWSAVLQPWLACLVEPLFGIAAGLWLGTMGSYAARLAPDGSLASAQAMLSAIFDGLGVGTGNLVSGMAYQNVGGKITWQIFGFANVCLAAVYASAVAFRAKTCALPKKSEEKLTTQTRLSGNSALLECA